MRTTFWQHNVTGHMLHANVFLKQQVIGYTQFDGNRNRNQTNTKWLTIRNLSLLSSKNRTRLARKLHSICSLTIAHEIRHHISVMNVEVIWHVMQSRDAQCSAVGIWEWFFSLSDFVLVAAITCNNVKIGKREWKSKNYFPLQRPYRMAGTRGGAQYKCIVVILCTLHTCTVHTHMRNINTFHTNALAHTDTVHIDTNAHRNCDRMLPCSDARLRYTPHSSYSYLIHYLLFAYQLRMMCLVIKHIIFAKYRSSDKYWSCDRFHRKISEHLCVCVCVCVSDACFLFFFFHSLRIIFVFVRHEPIKSNEIFVWIYCISSQMYSPLRILSFESGNGVNELTIPLMRLFTMTNQLHPADCLHGIWTIHIVRVNWL